jgi:hypothetical protein
VEVGVLLETVVYYGDALVSTAVHADRAARGFPGETAESFHVRVKKNEAG